MTARQLSHESVLNRAVRYRWLVLFSATALVALAQVPTAGVSWHYIVTGSHVLFSPTWPQLFALHPELQMGPLTFLLGAPFVLALHGATGMWAAFVFLLGVGLLTVRELRSLMRPGDRTAERRWLLASLAVMVAWGEVAVHYGHVDDAMALFFGVLALRLLRSGHPVIGALAVAIAIDFKPWAVPLIALVLLAPRGRRSKLLVLIPVAVAAVWVPFAVGAGLAGSSALTFTLPIAPASPLPLLLDDGTTPFWCRPAQLLGGLALAALAIRAGRWPSALVIVIALRMLLDPTTHNYYDVGIIIGAAIFDIVVTRKVVPLATVGVLGLIYLPSYALVEYPDVRGVGRTIALVAIILIGFARAPLIPAGAEPRPGLDRSGRRAQ